MLYFNFNLVLKLESALSSKNNVKVSLGNNPKMMKHPKHPSLGCFFYCYYWKLHSNTKTAFFSFLHQIIPLENLLCHISSSCQQESMFVFEK